MSEAASSTHATALFMDLMLPACGRHETCQSSSNRDPSGPRPGSTGRLRHAGFTPNLTHHAYHALDSHIVGFVLWVLPYIAISREKPDLAADFLKDFPADELPYLAEHIRQHAEDRRADTSEFEFGLDILLGGLERLRKGSAPSSCPRAQR